MGLFHEGLWSDADGARCPVELPEGDGAADGDDGPENDEDGRGVLCRETVPKMDDAAAVVDSQPRGDGVACRAADGEGSEELFSRHVQSACGEDEGAERHGRRQDGGEGHGEDGVVLHPVADALEDAGRDVLFDEGHAAGLADLVAEVSAERGACGGEENQQEPAMVLGGEDDDHDVGEAGQRERDEGAVDDGDKEDTEDAEAEEQVHEWAAVSVMRGHTRWRSCCYVSHHGDGSCDLVHIG
jgi:hypothetical protein